jgi:penicillin-binding protein 2D
MSSRSPLVSVSEISHVRRSRRPLWVALAFALVSAPAAATAQQVAAEIEEPWRLVQPAQSSLVYGRDGSLIGEIGHEWRTSVPISSLPKYLPQAFIAVEDQRFYQHDGVDVVGVIGALKDNLLGDRRGASTITQQLVGNMHPDIIDRRDKTIDRKLREQAAAREMEKHYTKAQILEAYLNQISFGHGWYGVEAAARHYFGKSASKLTLAEAATLAAMPKGPALYDPARYPDRVKQRRDLVLNLMVGQKYITRDEAETARREPVQTTPNAGLSAPSSYFVDAVRQQAERVGIKVANDGYRVFTTLEPGLQLAATVALIEGAAQVEARPGFKHITYANRPKGRNDYLQGAVVALDAATGEVLALVGGRNYQESPFNRAVNGVRQPGSAFKPIVYAAAIADSIPPNEIVPDTMLSIPMQDTIVYQPSNSDGLFLGPMTLREALTKSRNPVAVQLGLRVGMDSIAELAHRMGITSPIAPYPASAIGASAVRPIELVAAFATFANLGSTVEPRFIDRIEDRAGHVIWRPEPPPSSLVLDPRVAFIVRDMMRDVVERGTATAVRRFLPATVPVAGKTGTPNDNTDVWFVGMTPEIVAGVWLGFDEPVTIMPGAAGGSLAAPIWGQMIARYYAHRTAGEWQRPAGLVSAELDRETGMLADASTPPERRYVEYFLEGTEPAALRVNPWSIFQWGPIVF